MDNPSLICFGEVLWDLLPGERIAGGAPMNAAFHANNLGLPSAMISRVGDDAQGRELLQFLDKKGVSTELIQTDPNFPTGAVEVRLDQNGTAAYNVFRPVAWDYISPNEAMNDTVRESDALVFGTLACRSERSKRTLFELLENVTLRVLDVNLRSPWYSKNLLEELLIRADVAKVNRRELAILATWYDLKSDELGQMAFFKKKFELDILVLTKGNEGAVCLNDSGFCVQPGFQVAVQDTIGTGDAFLAGFLYRLLEGADDLQCLEFANAIGALTATKAGGTPDFNKNDVETFLSSMRSRLSI